jgi:hypothetical protein
VSALDRRNFFTVLSPLPIAPYRQSKNPIFAGLGSNRGDEREGEEWPRLAARLREVVWGGGLGGRLPVPIPVGGGGGGGGRWVVGLAGGGGGERPAAGAAGRWRRRSG